MKKKTVAATAMASTGGNLKDVPEGKKGLV